ncbi:restriction endonuclease [Macrococcus capreoli]|uniref:restriction endonuclease n=1 Tax=Macrococcus capreoli TaxID=2982690 RepID=UPI003EE681F8
MSIENKTPIDDFSETKKSILREINQYITSIGHDKFERLIVSYLKHIGADKVVIPSKKDKGNNDARADIDVKAAFNKLGIVIYVQAKCHNGISDTTGIQQLLAYESEVDDDFKTLVPVKWFITSGELVNNYEEHLPEEYKAKADELKYIKS